MSSVPDQIGFSKPTPQFFEALFERAKNKKKETMLLIGDSLQTDILGGQSKRNRYLLVQSKLRTSKRRDTTDDDDS